MEDARAQLRDALWGASNWQACLRERFAVVSQTPPARGLAEQALLLARALEAIEPDRLFAVHMYVRAYKCSQDDTAPLVRARQLSREVGNLEFAAKAARLEYVHSQDPRSLYIEGVTWLDAEEPERAQQSLGMAKQALPDDDLVAVAAATARRQWPDDGTIIDELERRAASARSPEVGATYLLYAARILRSVGATGEEYGRMLLRAFTASPRDLRVCGLLERFLHGRGDQDGLLELYKRRIEAMTTPDEITEECRRAGTRLVLDGRFAGLGLRLLRRSLACAYEARLESVPGHIATHSLIRKFSEQANLLPDYLSLLVDGLDQRLAGLDRLWLGLAGLDIAWNQLDVAQTAYAYAAVVSHYAPEHPLLRAFHKSGGLEQGSPAETDDGVYLNEWQADDRDEELAFDGSAEPEQVGAADSMPEIELDDIFELASREIPAVGTDSVEVPIDEVMDDDVEFELEPEDLEFSLGDDGDGVPATVIPGKAMAALQSYHSKPAPLPPKPPPRSDAVVRAPRVAVPADVQLHVGELRLFTVTRDVSSTGMFLVTDADLDIGSDVMVTVKLPGADGFSLLAYEVKARVVRKTERGYGVEYVDPPAVFVMQISMMNAG